MSKIEDQRIAVWCNSDTNLAQTLIDAILLSLSLEKELCLFANYFTHKQESKLREKISQLSKTIKNDLPQLAVSILIKKGKLHKLTGELGEKNNVILFCTGLNLSNPVLKAFYRSGFPFYFSKPVLKDKNHLKKVLIPLDFRNSTKDSTLWGSYLGRFNNSDIHLLMASDKDTDLKQKTDNLIAFVKKFYSQFLFHYSFFPGASSSWKIHREAAQKASEFDLLVFTGSFNVSFADYILGPFEKQIINNLKNVPVLLVNPQKEMYVLCS